VWINGARVTDNKGFCADPKTRPGEVIRNFAT
jgi:N-acyl-D-amino-acid deacylase